MKNLILSLAVLVSLSVSGVVKACDAVPTFTFVKRYAPTAYVAPVTVVADPVPTQTVIVGVVHPVAVAVNSGYGYGVHNVGFVSHVATQHFVNTQVIQQVHVPVVQTTVIKTFIRH